jgi:hypothetical protein
VRFWRLIWSGAGPWWNRHTPRQCGGKPAWLLARCARIGLSIRCQDAMANSGNTGRNWRTTRHKSGKLRALVSTSLAIRIWQA